MKNVFISAIYFVVLTTSLLVFPAVVDASDSFRCGTAELQSLYPQNIDWEVIRENHRRAPERSRSEYFVGDTKTFWVWDLSEMPPVDIQISATCRAKGDHGYVWVSDTEWGTSVDATDVDGVFAAWETGTPAGSMDPSMGICEIAETVFGPVPDELDGDPRVNIMFYDIGSYHGYTFDGFFNAYDQMTDEEAQGSGRHSNECEIIYLDCNPSDPDDPYMLGVLSHEFQHLIHWGADPNEETWVNEACSQLSWFLCGFETDGAENAFANNPNNNLISWDSTGGDYGQVMLFSLYLYKQFGGAESILAIVSEPGNGFTGIGNALSGIGYPWSTDQVFNNWAVANLLDDATIDRGQFGYSLFDPPSFKIQQTFSTFPTGSQTSSPNKWAAQYYACTGGLPDWNLQFDAAGEPVDVFLAASDRVIPMDPAFTEVQAEILNAPDESVDLVIVNHASSSEPVTVGFEVSDTESTDRTPPYVREASPWGVCEWADMARIVIRDELGSVDLATIALKINGSPSMEPIVEPLPNGDILLWLDLSGVDPMEMVGIEVEAGDDLNHDMTPYTFYFMMTDAPPVTLGVTLQMPAHDFKPGDPCYLDAIAGNPGELLSSVPLFVILDVFGNYYSAPGWENLNDGISWYTIDLPTGETTTSVLPSFTWPSGVGSAAGLKFYGAMTNAVMNELLGVMSTWEFGWSE